jgi:AcrR family transcriptional regulator
MVVISPPVGQGRRRADRRRAILDAATELFADQGYAGTSVQEIADAAGTHKTTVLYHFASKEALYEAVLDEALGRIAEVMREFLAGDFVRARVSYLVDQVLAFYAEHPSLARLLQRELLEQGGSEAYLKRFVDPIYVPAVASFERAMKAGLIRPIDPAFFIHDTHVTLIGYFCHRPLLERLRPGVDPFSVEALIARREYLVEQIFRQLTPEGRRRADAAPRRKSGGMP